MKNKVYVSGSLFKQSDIVQRKKEAALIKQYDPDCIVYNPIEADINDKSTLPTAKDIFIGDFNQVKDSNAILVALDDNDPGMIAEVGIAYGMNFVIEELLKITSKKQINNDDIVELVKKYPIKKVYAHLSDIRIPTAHCYKQNYIPYGINQFVIGNIEEMGNIHSTYEDAIKEMINDFKNNK